MKVMDRRQIKTQSAIKTSFLTLLENDGFDEITVKGIAEEADIGRKTFYLHYIDKFELLDTIVDSYLLELKEICEYKKDIDLSKGSIIWFEFFEENKAFFASLFKSTTTFSFRRKLLTFIKDDLEARTGTALDEMDEVKKKVTLKFLSMAVVGVVESFLLDELDADMEDVAVQVGELVYHNL
ncbi:TetR/AcrR family transcriptional regulator [Corticicoccus populi]|uniref:TetR/AcrR family transcriptional regulator n=1 Tax=Corticicoccus populi TaxID=1812821 RepID=A0ABW5WYC3_9STAP